MALEAGIFKDHSIGIWELSSEDLILDPGMSQGEVEQSVLSFISIIFIII